MTSFDRHRLIRDPGARKRFLTGLELNRAGIEMMRQRLRREHPTATEQEVSKMLSAWLWRGPESSAAREPEHELVLSVPPQPPPLAPGR